ncbi:MAG: ABC transporter ATP-binding protein, partial [Clostridia bacterium]|nr:ABC transporter ATP-binding protein [Clostridia bacterium]
MLEVINLTKIYKQKKGGVDVAALNGITLNFPNTGMVFLLGKSGSGKSTLLNVCGGLDSPTEGEIIVKGKSSKTFSGGDFDSYRNTYVGFIFQEYNILNEFTVEDNVALALELQGKPKDKQVISKLLEEVDLTGYANRKPNTLSGGQKQRIAIARALVKNPEIIMADEPTGALDSATGKQVFDTLKKLSKTKLVIVVSHDRDFAEYYADRIIELKDGQVLSDVTKTYDKSEELSANLKVVGDTLCVSGGQDLSDEDFDRIKSFVKSGGELVIAKGEREVTAFKQAARISENGQETFAPTVATEAKQTEQNCKFIRSK